MLDVKNLLEQRLNEFIVDMNASISAQKWIRIVITLKEQKKRAHKNNALQFRRIAERKQLSMLQTRSKDGNGKVILGTVDEFSSGACKSLDFILKRNNAWE